MGGGASIWSVASTQRQPHGTLFPLHTDRFFLPRLSHFPRDNTTPTEYRAGAEIPRTRVTLQREASFFFSRRFFVCVRKEEQHGTIY